MKQSKKPTTTPSLKTVKQEIQHWRSTRQKARPMPEELWQSAAEVAKAGSLGCVAKELGLNYTALKNRVCRQQSSNLPEAVQQSEFIQLGVEQSGIMGSCEVELETAGGSKLKIKFRPGMGINIGELWRDFLRRP